MPDWVRHGPMALWRRRRWPVIGAVVAALIVLYLITGSVLNSIILVIILVALAIGLLVLAQRRAENQGPPRRRQQSPQGGDAQDVWQAALRHLPETFTMAADRTMLASDLVELRMNPADLRALGNSIDPQLVTSSSCDAYRARIAEHGARLAGSGQPTVSLVSDPDLPPGRYRLQPRSIDPFHLPPSSQPSSQSQYESPSPSQYQSQSRYQSPSPSEYPSPSPSPSAGGSRMADEVRDARTMAVDQVPPSGAPGGDMTMAERLPVPPLRLLTGGTVAEATKSGARVGRGGDVELRLPDVPTVSRVHAELTYSDGQWWITNQGRNGLTVNGTLVTSQSPVSDGDVIQWGNRHDALTSRVQVG